MKPICKGVSTMSEIINNREQQTTNQSDRLERIKQIFKDLHNGKSIEDVKAYFNKEIGTITVEEISQIKHEELRKEGISIEEVKRLYSLHTEVFKGSIVEVEREERPEDQPGHPVHTFILENQAITKLVETKVKVHLEEFIKSDSPESINKLLEDCNLLLDIDKHYSRKENLLFPYLEKYGIYGPTNNMWRIDDFIRDGIKDAKRLLANYNEESQAVIDVMTFVINEVLNMVYRE